jgi:hypothetical protein
MIEPKTIQFKVAPTIVVAAVALQWSITWATPRPSWRMEFVISKSVGKSASWSNREMSQERISVDINWCVCYLRIIRTRYDMSSVSFSTFAISTRRSGSSEGWHLAIWYWSLLSTWRRKENLRVGSIGSSCVKVNLEHSFATNKWSARISSWSRQGTAAYVQ